MKSEFELRAMTTEQIAQRLQVSERTVRRMIKDKELLAYKIGKEWRVDEPDLKAYIARLKKKEDWHERQGS